MKCEIKCETQFFNSGKTVEEAKEAGEYIYHACKHCEDKICEK